MTVLFSSVTAATCFLVVFAAMNSHAQPSLSEIEIVQEDFSLQINTSIAQQKSFEEDDGITYWATYDALETRLKILKGKQIQIVQELAGNCLDILKDKIPYQLNTTIVNNKRIEKLLKQYTNFLCKKTGASIAAQLKYSETYFNVLTKASINTRTPLSGVRANNS